MPELSLTSSTPAVKPWFLYIIRTKNQHLYTGVTTDVERRFSEHQQGGLKGAKALRGKGPLILAFQQLMASKQQAMRLEYAIKQLSKSKKELLVAGKLDWQNLL
ncbi:GIY-YIG nuclease family protein [Agarivorans sp. DSG3-1]|uniref:GIY-YIG nuclease family protein n=1 Tax=Agarivorans sp. DSG3-1 TaxID=3342249 RepID=UPI00398F4FEE